MKIQLSIGNIHYFEHKIASECDGFSRAVGLCVFECIEIRCEINIFPSNISNICRNSLKLQSNIQ